MNFNNEDLMVSLSVVEEGRNYGTIKGISKSESNFKLLDIQVQFSNMVEEKLSIFNDVNKADGIVRKLINATIAKEGEKVYNLNKIVGMDVIIDIEKATSKNGNEFWKIKNFEKVDENTDTTQFEFVNKVDIKQPETVEDVSELEDLLD